MQKEVEAYHYVMFRWWTRLELGKISKDLTTKFEVITLAKPSDGHDLSLLKDERYELEVKSDTLIAFLSPIRAVLSQKEAAPFTSRDVELREKVLDLYPRSRPTPFPWLFSVEPKYQTDTRTRG